MQTERQRSEFATRLETLHTQWTCKLQIHVTDIATQYDKTQENLNQIEQLFQQLQNMGDNQSKLLEQRQ